MGFNLEKITMQRLVSRKVWTCTDHEGHWPVGVASVVVAHTEDEARELLIKELATHGLTRPDLYTFTLTPLDLDKDHAVVLNDGSY